MDSETFDCIGRSKIKEIIQFRIKENVSLLDAITQIAIEQKINSAIIISGIGALSKAVCRNLKWFPEEYPVKTTDRIYYEINKPLELLSLAGWITRKKDNVPAVHAHFSASTVDGEQIHSFGGHLTKDTLTGIKLVVALAIIEENIFYADYAENTKDIDLFVNNQH